MARKKLPPYARDSLLAISRRDSDALNRILRLGRARFDNEPEVGAEIVFRCLREKMWDAFACLARHGADFESPSPNGGPPPLHWCCLKAQPDGLRALLALGANPNSRMLGGEHPLACCAKENSVECAEILLAQIAKSSERGTLDASPGSPLGAALIAKNPIFLSMLCDADALKGAAAPRLSGMLTICAMRGYSEHAKLLIANGADPNHRDNLGNIPIALACMRGNYECAFALAEAGSTLDNCASDHSSAFAIASRFGHDELAAKLESWHQAITVREILEKNTQPPSSAIPIGRPRI